jgi:hypothetical protein
MAGKLPQFMCYPLARFLTTMSKEESKIFAKLFFESTGYTVETIPVSGKERADLKATLLNETIIIEAKGKASNQGYYDLLEKVRANGFGSITREEIAWNALSSIAEKANSQLDATPASENSARILFISCLHNDWEFVLETFEHRLYGDVQLAIVHEINGLPINVETRPCFYYNGSDFYRYRSIDAAVLAGPNGVKILVNEFGIRVKHFRLTKLYSDANQKGVLCDPQLLRESDKILAILDPLRNDPNAKWQYLLDNYGFRTSVMRSYYYKALTTVQIHTDK